MYSWHRANKRLYFKPIYNTLAGTGNAYNLISSNNCMGKAVVVEGGTGNSAWGNKFDATDDLPLGNQKNEEHGDMDGN